ncbi:hypothetical protein [Bifidobacterium gallicum]|uniref:hypothetical protein n=1 Tax=Bifidobacterium gallicum TaxID=78342 RepID=UPI0011DCCD81|nr:hypothetical protein [Bifidobacterium gallicum]
MAKSAHRAAMLDGFEAAAAKEHEAKEARAAAVDVVEDDSQATLHDSRLTWKIRPTGREDRETASCLRVNRSPLKALESNPEPVILLPLVALTVIGGFPLPLFRENGDWTARN